MCDSQLKLYSPADIVVRVLETIDCVVNVLAAWSKATQKQSFFSAKLVTQVAKLCITMLMTDIEVQETN